MVELFVFVGGGVFAEGFFALLDLECLLNFFVDGLDIANLHGD